VDIRIRAGVGTTVESVGGFSYRCLFIPDYGHDGVVHLAFLWHLYNLGRKLDFLKEVLVAPVSRASVFAGKMLGGATDAMVQVIYLIIIGLFFLNVPFTP